MLRVGINAISLASPVTGIGQYTRNLLEHLGVDGEVETRCFTGLRWQEEVPPRSIIGISHWKRVFKAIVPAPYSVARAAQQLAFDSGLRRSGVQLYHEPAFLPFRFNGPTVVTTHDLAWIRHPETHPDLRVKMLNREFPRAIERADALITDSEFVRKEIIEAFSVSPEKIWAIPLAASSGMCPRQEFECSEILARRNLKWRNFILSVGTLEPRKNLKVLAAAYARLPAEMRTRFPLVVVGGRGWKSSGRASGDDPDSKLVGAYQLGYVSHQELNILYSSARMLIYPSIYEGFGLPPLEAMASGTPAVVSNEPSLSEVAGDAAIRIDSHDIVGLTDVMLRLLEDELECRRLSALGIVRARQFSWGRCARETVGVYRHVLDRNPPVKTVFTAP